MLVMNEEEDGEEEASSSIATQPFFCLPFATPSHQTNASNQRFHLHKHSHSHAAKKTLPSPCHNGAPPASPHSCHHRVPLQPCPPIHQYGPASPASDDDTGGRGRRFVHHQHARGPSSFSCCCCGRGGGGSGGGQQGSRDRGVQVSKANGEGSILSNQGRRGNAALCVSH